VCWSVSVATMSSPIIVVSTLAQSLSELYSGNECQEASAQVHAEVVANLPSYDSVQISRPVACDNAVFVQFPMLRQLNLCAGSWVSVHRLDTGDTHPAVVHASVRGNDGGHQRTCIDAAGITPILAYNLKIAAGATPMQMTEEELANAHSSHSKHTYPLQLRPLMDLASVLGVVQPTLPVSRHVVLVKHASPVLSPLDSAPASDAAYEGNLQSETTVQALLEHLGSSIR
jgi:hypothetical protein